MASATFRFGAKKGVKKEEDYDFVFDEQIAFVQALQLAGTEEMTMKVSSSSLFLSYHHNVLSILFTQKFWGFALGKRENCF